MKTSDAVRTGSWRLGLPVVAALLAAAVAVSLTWLSLESNALTAFEIPETLTDLLYLNVNCP